VNFAAGTKDVFVTYPSSRAVYLDAAGSAVSVLDIGTLGTSTANITTANITAGTVSTTPSSANDLVNKTYVDTLVASGIHFHQPVRVESPINLNATYDNGTAGVGATLTNAGTQAALVIDGITMVVADRVLVYEQTNQTQNGVYVVTDIGSGSTNWILTRSDDADTFGFAGPDTLSEGSTFFVQQGATGAGETYTCNTVGTITFGTTNITFAQISSAQIYSAGTGLTLSGTQFSLSNTGTAGTYGDAATVPVITTNAQGQVTGVTPTAIAITGAAVSGDITGKSGGTTAALTAGAFMSAAGTFDGAAARTFDVDATSANTASKVVARDASGNFSAGTITATLSGSATSATTATNLAGGAANQLAFQTGAGATGFVPAPTASGQTVAWDGSSIGWAAGPVAGITYLLVTANYTAANREGVLTDTSGGSFTVTLPVSPTTGAQVIVADAGSAWGTNNLTVGRNGSTIGGLAENLVCDITGASVQFVYDGSTWEVYAQIGGQGGNAVTLDGVQTLTNKTISGASNTLTNVSLTTAVTGTLPVANGGTGATTLTANNVILGNGTSAVQVVAPSTAGNVLTSNGTTWTSAAVNAFATGDILYTNRALTTPNWLPANGAVYLQSSYSALYAEVGLLANSSSAVTWTQRTFVFSNPPFFLGYVNGEFLASTSSNQLARSATGTTWTSVTSPPSSYAKCITFGAGIYVAGRNLTGVNGISTATVLGTWTTRNSNVAQSLNAIVFGNGLFVAGGVQGVMTTSPDGTTWTSRTSGFAGATINGLAYGNGVYVAVGDSGIITSSTDGITWTQRFSIVNTSFRAVVFDGVKFVAAAQTSPGGLSAVSSDGITWTTGSATQALWSLADGGGLLIAAASATNIISVSTDGLNWTTRIPNLGANGSNTSAYGGGNYVVGSDNGTAPTIVTSTIGYDTTTSFAVPTAANSGAIGVVPFVKT
jgi:hypothetical protein